jgi:tRNA G18 (ribose-2'-O)-methylase SpoU
MGTIFRLPVVEVSSLVESLHEVRRQGVHTIAAHPHAAGTHLSQAPLGGDCCLVFGSEGHGVSPAVLETCDDAVAIPMQNGVDSLNVSSASAAFLYEAARQRGKA